MQLIRRVRDDERGAALITALAATMIMLALGMAILAIVDTQASSSATERTRDRGFNLAESALNTQAFVLGRNWPASMPVPPEPNPPNCGDAGAGFQDVLGSTETTSPAVARLRKTLNASYTDSAYAGAIWKINLCDDNGGSTVWSDTILQNSTWDENANKMLWVVARSDIDGEGRNLVGLVHVRENGVIPSKYGLVAGALTDDLGGTVNALTNNALGGVLNGLLGTSPTVAPDPLETPSGVTGVRCGATDLQLLPISTCLAGTVGALSTLPIVSNVLTGGQLVKFPTVTTATPANIDQLRAQAIAAGTWKDVSLGATSETTTQPCQLQGSPGANSIAFIERVGNGDQYCVIDVPHAGLAYRALIVGSGRVILRGAAITGALPVSPTSRTFTGVVYALNRQRLPVADGGLNLGDSATPGREVIRIERGAHVKGGVYADGRSAKVGIHPPLSVNNAQLRDAVCKPLSFFQETLCYLTGTVGELLTFLGLGAVGNLVTGLLDQLNPQRADYGSAIVSNVDAIKSLTAYGASGVVPGSFRDLQGR